MKDWILTHRALLAGALGTVAALAAALVLLQLWNAGEREPLSSGGDDNTPGERESAARNMSVPETVGGEATAPQTRGNDAQRASATGVSDAELEARVRKISARHQGDYGVVLWQPATGRRVAVNSGQSFKAASLAKLPVLLALYEAADRGRLSLDERISIRPSDIQPGTGKLQNYPPGTTMTLRECARYLIKESDNTAWSMLEDRLGKERIRSELERAGADSTRYEYARHSTTPEDVLKLLRRISDPEYTSARLSEEMLSMMTDTSYEERLPRGLPENVRVSHKIGTLGTSFGDAGIVFPPEGKGPSEPYYVVVLSENTSETEARDAMQEISLTAYRAFVDPEAEPRSAEKTRRS